MFCFFNLVLILYNSLLITPILTTQINSFEYLALSGDEFGMRNGLEYKYVLDTENLNNKETLLTKSVNDDSILLIESNRTKRNLDELMKNLQYLTSDLNTTHVQAKSLSITEDLCLFSNIKNKINECFTKSED